MFSRHPKVLLDLGGKPLLAHILNSARLLQPDILSMVIGSDGSAIRQRFENENILWIEQPNPLGTGDAVKRALDTGASATQTLVLFGDVPMVPVSVLEELLSIGSTKDLVVLSTNKENPTGYGRIIRNQEDDVIAIVEEKDASDTQRGIREINCGMMLANTRHLVDWLQQIDHCNAQKEYYLTDVVKIACSQGAAVGACCSEDDKLLGGINTPAHLALAERLFQSLQASTLLAEGVRFKDPGRFDLRGTLKHGKDVTIDIGVILEGCVQLDDDVSVGAHSVLRNCTVGSGTIIEPHTFIDGAHIGPDCHIGPFARLRPHSQIDPKAHIGNFVEIKNSNIGEDSKIGHLSYIGDARIGIGVNIGAGTITCNFDGQRKHSTIVEDGAFVGSGTELIAPVKIGKKATIAAGSTITHDACPGDLTVARARQQNMGQWIAGTGFAHQQEPSGNDADK